MTDFSICDCAGYLEHLADISVHRQMVVASDNICNQFGILLLRRGTPLGMLAAEKMRGHRLNKALDEVLQLRRALDVERLADTFLEFLASEPDLRQINEHFRFEGRVRHLCHSCEWHPALLQQLSVLQHVLPHVFHRALFSAWLGSLIASQRELEPQDIRLVFQAGLFHDLGLLHIDATLAGKKTAISAAEWASIQSHVGIGATIVQQYGVNDERLAQVIAQHHERADGAGYPHGETDTDIDPAALIIALGDMIHALRFPGLPACSATFADCMPFLRVNRLTFGEANNLAATRILLCARYAVTENGSEARTCPAVHELIEANLSLGRLLHSIAALHRLLDGERGEGLAARIGSLVTQVQWISMSSGLGTGTLGKWLESNAPESAADAGLREIQSTTREVLWLLRRIERLLVELLASGEPHADVVALESIASGFSAELAHAWQFSAPHG